MLTQKDNTLEKFRALEAVLNESSASGSLGKTVEGIKKKLAAEKASFLSMFHESEDRVMMPSMGLIEMTSEKTEDANYYFGSPVKSRDLIRIRIYQASVNPNTEEIFPEELISDVAMTEKQFGDILSQPGRGTGFPITQVVRDGFDADPYDPKTDPTKSDFKRITESLGKTKDVKSRINQIRESLARAEEKGRLGKKEGVELAQSMKSLSGNLPSNSRYRVEKISEAYASRISESILTLHLDIRSEQSKLGFKKEV